MGQDNSCGICGEYYLDCRHALKEHIAHPDNPDKSLCGKDRRHYLFLDDSWTNEWNTEEKWDALSSDPCGICAHCKRMAERAIQAGKIKTTGESFLEMMDG